MRKADLIGTLVAGGRWRVIAEGPSTPRWDARWYIECAACGTRREQPVRVNNKLRLRCRVCRPPFRVVRVYGPVQLYHRNHGLSRLYRKEYWAWSNMKGRCLNPNDDKYPLYGGRGIKICDRWMKSFRYFFEDVGPAPFRRASIDRIDPNGNYEPNNVRWATFKQQNQHLRRSHRHSAHPLSQSQ